MSGEKGAVDHLAELVRLLEAVDGEGLADPEVFVRIGLWYRELTAEEAQALLGDPGRSGARFRLWFGGYLAGAGYLEGVRAWRSEAGVAYHAPGYHGPAVEIEDPGPVVGGGDLREPATTGEV